SPCGVSPCAIGSQQASARPAALRPRTGIPGHGSPSTGTGRTFRCPLLGYHPVAAGWNSHVAKLVRRQCAASSPSHPPRTYPRSAIAVEILARVASCTTSGWLSAADTVAGETCARRATSTRVAPGRRTASLGGRWPRNTYVSPWHWHGLGWV